MSDRKNTARLPSCRLPRARRRVPGGRCPGPPCRSGPCYLWSSRRQAAGITREPNMSDTVRKVTYCYVKVPNRPGNGEVVLNELCDDDVNLIAYTGFPARGGAAQLDFVVDRLGPVRRGGRRPWRTAGGGKKGFRVPGARGRGPARLRRGPAGPGAAGRPAAGAQGERWKEGLPDPGRRPDRRGAPAPGTAGGGAGEHRRRGRGLGREAALRHDPLGQAPGLRPGREGAARAIAAAQRPTISPAGSIREITATLFPACQ